MKLDKLEVILDKVGDNIWEISTIELADILELRYASVLSLVRKYENNFQEIKPFIFSEQKHKHGGKSTQICNLNSAQVLFFVSLMKNTKEIIDFKFKIVHEYYKTRDKVRDILDNTSKGIKEVNK